MVDVMMQLVLMVVDMVGTNGINGINSNNGRGIATLDMLIVALQRTNNPFPFHETRLINWRTQVRADETLEHE